MWVLEIYLHHLWCDQVSFIAREQYRWKWWAKLMYFVAITGPSPAMCVTDVKLTFRPDLTRKKFLGIF